MLKSKEILEKAKKINESYYEIYRKIKHDTEELESFGRVVHEAHKKEMKELNELYEKARKLETSELNNAISKFEYEFPRTINDFYMESKIVEKLGKESFELLREMKKLQVCGYYKDIVFYTPMWR